MWMSKAHYALLNQFHAEQASHSESLLRATREQLSHLEARNAQLEMERRELIDRLFVREDRVNAPPAAMNPADSWLTEMQEQIKAMDSDKTL